MDCRSCEYYIHNSNKHYCCKYKRILNGYSLFWGKASAPFEIRPCAECIAAAKEPQVQGRAHSYEYDKCLNKAPYRGLCFTCCNGNKCERPEVYSCPNYVWRGLSDFTEV